MHVEIKREIGGFAVSIVSIFRVGATAVLMPIKMIEPTMNPRCIRSASHSLAATIPH
jgi:hypothetical protein